MSDADSRTECASYTYSDDCFESLSPPISPTVSQSQSPAFLLPESRTESTATDLSCETKARNENSFTRTRTIITTKSEGDCEKQNDYYSRPTAREATTVSDKCPSQVTADDVSLPASSTVGDEKDTPLPIAQPSALTHEHDCTTSAKQVRKRVSSR